MERLCGRLDEHFSVRARCRFVVGAAHQTARRMASSFGLALMATLLGGARNVWIMVAAAHLIMIIPLAVTSRND
jgi:hypothetical protein